MVLAGAPRMACRAPPASALGRSLLLSALLYAVWQWTMPASDFVGGGVAGRDRSTLVQRRAEETWMDWRDAQEGKDLTLAENCGGVAQAQLAVKDGWLKPALKWWPKSKLKSYFNYVYQKRWAYEEKRIRLCRIGIKGSPVFALKVKERHQKGNTDTNHYYETLGWYRPMLNATNPKFFTLKADRAVVWLRSGALMTRMVANLMDRAGIIRRLPPNQGRGEVPWAWRVDPDSGPDPPEGWKYDGPNEITWNTQFIDEGKAYKKRRILAEKRSKKYLPEIEKYGFVSYRKVLANFEKVCENLAGSHFHDKFTNTDIPAY